MTHELTTLPNGLRVISETMPQVESVSITLSVGSGARNESKEENGISHLLEHMAFKGTKRRSARDIAESFDMIGGQSNAYTSMESTVYYAKVLKENAELAADILGDIMLNSVFDEAELAREQEVIVQEIAMHHDAPDDLIHDYYDEKAFPNQPLGRSILSTAEQVTSYRRDDLIAYMNKHYRPHNMVLSAAGNISHAKLIELAERYFPFPASDAPPKPERARYVGGDVRVNGDFEQCHLLMGLPTVNIHSPHYYTLQLYASILGGGMSSRLFQEVREKRGLAYTVFAMGSAYDDCGVMSIYAATAPEKAGELSGVLVDEIKRMADRIEPNELLRAKNQSKSELLMARENPQTVANWLGRHLLRFGEVRTAQAIAQKIDAVTSEDIISLAEQMLSSNLNLAALGPVDGLMAYEALKQSLESRL